MPVGESESYQEPTPLEKPINPLAGMSPREISREYGSWHRNVYLKNPDMPADAAKKFGHEKGLAAQVVEILQDPQRLETEISDAAGMAKAFMEYYIGVHSAQKQQKPEDQEIPKEKQIAA